jgi:hypothetical protein
VPFQLFLTANVLFFLIATGAVYGATGLLRVLKAAMLAASVACIVLGHRFALLLITLHST